MKTHPNTSNTLHIGSCAISNAGFSLLEVLLVLLVASLIVIVTLSFYVQLRREFYEYRLEQDIGICALQMNELIHARGVLANDVSTVLKQTHTLPSWITVSKNEPNTLLLHDGVTIKMDFDEHQWSFLVSGLTVPGCIALASATNYSWSSIQIGNNNKNNYLPVDVINKQCDEHNRELRLIKNVQNENL